MRTTNKGLTMKKTKRQNDEYYDDEYYDDEYYDNVDENGNPSPSQNKKEGLYRKTQKSMFNDTMNSVTPAIKGKNMMRKTKKKAKNNKNKEDDGDDFQQVVIKKAYTSKRKNKK